MKRIVIGFIIILFILLLGYTRGFAQDAEEESSINIIEGPLLSMNQGKNLVHLERPIYVRELIQLYPEIESVSYYDDFLQQHYGFVNFNNGVGKNFLMVPDVDYEIFTSESITVYIP